jgi:RHS repeat-associated protein
VAVTGSTSASIFYDYDPLGRRITKTTGGTGVGAGGTTTGYLLDGDEEIAEYNVTGGAWSLLRRYVTGPSVDERIAHVEGSALSAPAKTYYHFNHQGSVVAMTDGSGAVTQRLSYDEYGVLSPSASPNGEAYRFTGRRFDPETGLYYYRARYYSPALGRFLQTDPVGYKADLNLYEYVWDAPIDGVDPSGLFDESFFNPAAPGDQRILALMGDAHIPGAFFVGAHGNQAGPMQSAAITTKDRANYSNWSFVENDQILAHYPKGTGTPIVLYSCFAGDSASRSASLSRLAGAVVYAAKDYAWSRQLSPGVNEAYSAKKDSKGDAGQRSVFVAVGDGAKPFGDAITSIVVDKNTGKTTVNWQRVETDSRIPQNHSTTFCTDKSKCGN